MAWPKGRPRSQDTRDKIAAAQRGREHSPETKAKIAAGRTGKRHTPETKAKISSARMAQTPERRSEIARTFGFTGKRHGAKTKALMAVACIRRKSHIPLTAPQHRTRPERVVAAALRRAGVGFQEQVPVGPWLVDFLLDSGDVVEVHGCYWHGCPRCGMRVRPERWRLDRAKRTFLERRGVRLIEIWEHDTKGPFDITAFLSA